MKIPAATCAIVLLFGTTAANAQVGVWRNYTSMKDVRGVARSGENYWAATNGGLFAWDTANTFRKFTGAEGLQSTDLTAIQIDEDGDIWTGTSGGVIHILTPRSGALRYVLNIAEAEQTAKGINRISIFGDTVLICSQFGLSVFSKDRFQFGDTYTKFGTLLVSSRISVTSAVIHNGSIWAAVSDGQNNHRVAVGSLSHPNLLAPESWTLQTVGTGTTVPRSLSVFSGTLYAATTSGLYWFDGSSWQPVAALSGRDVVALTSSTNVLAACVDFLEVFTVDPQHTTTLFGDTLPYRGTTVVLDPSGVQPVVGTLGGGVLTFGTSWTSHVPNGPNSNQFISIAVDRDGAVWGASGSSNGSGFYRYDGNEWKSFNMQNSILPTDNYYRVSAGCNGSVWASSWGWGVVEMPPGTNAVDSAHIFGTNVGMQGLPSNPDYVVVGPILCDARSNHWMSVVLAGDKNVIVIRKADGTWDTLPVKFSTGPATTLLDDKLVDRQMVVDAAENLWSVIRDDLYKGVVTLGNRGGIDDSIETFLTLTDGLPSNDVRTIVIDRDNDIWVGTDKGIGIILDPSNPKRSGSIASYKPLDEVGLINTIAVDALNQKWVGTPQGAFLYSQDGTQQLASHTVENTKGKLIDNDVKSIAIDSKTGTVYFGTLNGLASLTTSAVAPVASFSRLHIYPNPYRIPGVGTGGDRILLTVDGLVANSSLKILSVEGRVVRELGTPGGRIGFWDGRDAEGRDVASGIYIVAAFAEDGSQVASGKVAVVRK